MRFCLPVAVVVCLIVPRAKAQAPVISGDRPGFAESSSVLPARQSQIQFGLWLTENDGSSLSVPMRLRLGVADRLELRIDSDLVQYSSGDVDLAPIWAGLTLPLLQGDVPIAIVGALQPPSGSGGLRSTDYAGEVRLASDLTLRNGAYFTPNIGVALAEGQSSEVVFASYLGKEFKRRLWFVDVEIRRNPDAHTAIVGAGVVWMANPALELDLFGGLRLAGSGYPEWFLSTGFSRRIAAR